MKPSRCLPWVLAIVGASLSLGGCGKGDTPTTPTPSPTPLPEVTIVVGQGTFPGLQPLTIVAITFTTTSAGRLEATTDWTFATNNIEVYLVRGTNPCSYDQFNQGTCPFVAFSESPTAKPERLSVASLAADNYTLYIGNRGSTAESYAYQITLTSRPTAAATDGEVSVSATTRSSKQGSWKRVVLLR